MKPIRGERTNRSEQAKYKDREENSLVSLPVFDVSQCSPSRMGFLTAKM
jgi:hypothetical protein